MSQNIFDNNNLKFSKAFFFVSFQKSKFLNLYYESVPFFSYFMSKFMDKFDMYESFKMCNK